MARDPQCQAIGSTLVGGISQQLAAIVAAEHNVEIGAKSAGNFTDWALGPGSNIGFLLLRPSSWTPCAPSGVVWMYLFGSSPPKHSRFAASSYITQPRYLPNELLQHKATGCNA